MAQPVRIQPDLEFVKELQAVGGESLKKCYQCATCSVACPISPTNNPYPRKEMVWASWGLKDKLLSDVDIWLCHNCGTCSDLCPRGAKPGDLLSALRNMTYARLTQPTVVGKWLSSAQYLPILVAIPAILWAVIWAIMAGVNGSVFPEGEIVFGKLFPGDFTIDPIFMLTFFTAVGILFKGTKNLIASFQPEGRTMMLGKTKHWTLHLVDVILEEVLTHTKFKDCGADKSDRKVGHMVLMYSFVILAFVTGVVAVGHWGGKVIPAIAIHTPMPLTFPVKILANIGAVMLLVGLAILTVRRKALDPKKTSSNYYDWYLLGVIWVVAVTGVLSQLFRLAGIAPVAYSVYYVHLVAVWMLFAYLPWSKLGHLVYRTAALTYVRAMGRR
ncbi:quinone-interacting membrane-bound oxidoreductase complex subunit QmoC [Nitratidesulfovibrio sp. SRB-5]|uniref:Heterodisulfide reductase, transmembrane subunit, putative n=1 Tax=Nitratidesulfovibrio vulgaris (strain DSM 19637 / Miyazaki F) TaxID=883 RepID=B8DS78_NITV9|nr:quinone-interacting membrane-bound oxidoreductase complex subunit QmoC [Nitratidesulfovibrio sp. SRB-5]MBZ2171070.1 quinone-interacting membrane-bound oxidoreductase complex subunit QmoC [Nitratidesulfovibrio sp. SRB-5]RXF76163.1 heterodisulfide reductase subunit E [Desulfovibrio sp. DS-1]